MVRPGFRGRTFLSIFKEPGTITPRVASANCCFTAPKLERLAQKVQAKGYTMVPLELYFIGGRAKVEIALARGKQDWDKRQALREAQDKREAARAMAAANRRRG